MPPVAVTGLSAGSRPETVAVFTIVPASTSACVTVYVALQSIVALGASVAGATGVHVIADRPASGSETSTPWTVRPPLLVTEKS